MKVLLLGRSAPRLSEFLKSRGHEVAHTEERELTNFFHCEFLVSYGYRHILRNDVLERFEGRAINLHISYLPWNRGADPNFWSFLENTPKGVSIHEIDAGLDTGALLEQREVLMSETETLTSSFNKLMDAMDSCFKSLWPKIEAGKIVSRPQVGLGSSHKTRDLDPFRHLLTEGWDTPVKKISDYGRAHGLFKS